MQIIDTLKDHIQYIVSILSAYILSVYCQYIVCVCVELFCFVLVSGVNAIVHDSL